MIRSKRLPPDIQGRLETLGETLARCPAVVFGYVFGGVASGRFGPLSDVDVAVYLDDGADPVDAPLATIGAVTKHLGTDELDLVVLNRAPTALVGRILWTRRVIYDRDPFRRHRFESHALRESCPLPLRDRRNSGGTARVHVEGGASGDPGSRRAPQRKGGDRGPGRSWAGRRPVGRPAPKRAGG